MRTYARPEISIKGTIFLDAAMAADILNLNVDYLKKLARAGKVPGKQIPENAKQGKWYFNMAAVRKALYGSISIDPKTNTYRKAK